MTHYSNIPDMYNMYEFKDGYMMQLMQERKQTFQFQSAKCSLESICHIIFFFNLICLLIFFFLL